MIETRRHFLSWALPMMSVPKQKLWLPDEADSVEFHDALPHEKPVTLICTIRRRSSGELYLDGRMPVGKEVEAWNFNWKKSTKRPKRWTAKGGHVFLDYLLCFPGNSLLS